MKKIVLHILISLCVVYNYYLYAQSNNAGLIQADYTAQLRSGDYRNALNIIKSNLDAIYSQRVDDKRVPTDFITLQSAEEGLDINTLFRERKAKLFFIEENTTLFTLHYDAGRCYAGLGEYNAALNHYYQALRYRSLEYTRDDEIFYKIAQVYKDDNKFLAYIHTLETAYELNPAHYEYSLELGKSLYRTNQRKKSIFHLKRYIKAQGDNLQDDSLYIKLATLYEGIGRYLDTAAYYQKYLKKRPEDGYTQFALGYVAYNHIGNYSLARSSFEQALQLLPEKEIFYKSKAYEYQGDMFLKDLKFEKAVQAYLQTITFQDQIAGEIKQKEEAIATIDNELRRLKSSLFKRKNFVVYQEYQQQSQEKDLLLAEKREKQYQYNKLNPGKIRWNIAEAYEKQEKLEKAKQYYREAILYNYQSNKAREKISKIELKIERGY